MSDIMDQLEEAHGLGDVKEDDFLLSEDVEPENQDSEQGEDDGWGYEEENDEVDNKGESGDFPESEVADDPFDTDEEEYEIVDPVGYAGEDSDGYDVWNTSTEVEEEGEEVEYDDEVDTDSSHTKSSHTEVLNELDNQIPTLAEVEGANTIQALASEFGIEADSYSLRNASINVNEIVFLDPLRNARKKSVKGLTQSVKEMGIVNPVHVMITEEYSDWLEGDSDDLFTGTRYVMLDGFRRIYAALRNGIEDVQAVIWEFNDPEYGNEVSLVLALLINKSQKRRWEEVWSLYQVLEARSAMAPSTLEYLLEIESGDAMKLKDVAMATMYPDVWVSLIDGEKTLDQAYNNLKKLRKEEDRASIEDGRGISEFEDSDGIVGDHSTENLSDEEAREILELSESAGALEFMGEDEEMLGIDEGELQSTSERKPLDPVLRQAILRRDNFTCQVCRLGEGVNSGIALGTFEIHHTASVMAGLDASRDDTGNISEDIDIPKLITLCSADHRLVHLIVRHDGKLGITKEEFEVLPEHMQDRWKEAGRLAKVLLWAEKKSGKKAQRAENIKLPTHKPFWEQEKENVDAMKIAESAEKYGRDYADSED